MYNLLYIPSNCPCCGDETEIRTEQSSGVQTLWCTNLNCSARGNRKLEHFVSRNAMNIDGISTATLEVLVEQGIITDFVSLFKLDEHKYNIISLPGFGIVSYNNMIKAVDKARNIKIANLIYALGIPNVGLTTSKLICKHFNNDIKLILKSTYSDLVNIDGVGEVIASNFVDYFNDKDNIEQFIDLYKQLNIIKEEVSTNNAMNGLSICVTGAVNVFPNRDAVKEIIENMGGKLTGSVSRSTSYLVTNDTSSGSRKNRAAQEYGIPILTEKEFIDKFNLAI